MKALALVEARNHVCCRYRVRAFERTLAASGWSLAIEPLATGLLRPPRPVRPGRPSSTPSCSSASSCRAGSSASSAGGRATADLRLRRRRPLPRLLRPPGPAPSPPVGSVQADGPAADVVIAGNAFLADCALEAGAHPDRVRVIPTCIDADRRRARPPSPARAGPGPGLDRLGEHAGRAGPAAAALGADRPRSPRRPAPDGLRPLPPVRLAAGGRRPLVRADRGGRRRRGRRRDQLGARRPLEPGQVRPEGPPVSGRRASRWWPTRWASTPR